MIENNAAITTATMEDVPQLAHLINSAYRGDMSRKGWTTEADLLDGIRIDELSLTEILHKQDAVLLKYTRSDGIISGCVHLQKEEDHVYLGMLTVAPDMQGAGIGKQLVKAAEAYAKQQGCTSIVMTVISVRHELIAWYQRLGYRATGELKPFPSDTRFGIPKQPLTFIVMKKEL